MTKRSVSTKDVLLRVAAQQFAAKGFEGASMRSIASAVGIQAASIFHHFPDGKAQLYDEIVQQVIDKITAQIINWESRANEPAQAIVEICLLFWDYFDGNEAAASVLLRDAFDPRGERGRRIRQQSETIQNIAAAFIRAAQSQNKLRNFDPEAFMFWACVYVLNFHGTTGIRESIWGQYSKKNMKQGAREHFLADLEHYLRPVAS
jgi:AcrR family transcriptional regulator